MSDVENISELSPGKRRFGGLVLLGVSFLMAYLFYENPEKLHVPFWLGMVVCGCFFIIGAAVILYEFISERAYNCIILLFLILMAIIPAWIAFGSGERECSGNIPFLNGEYSCRIVFGLSFLFMLLFIGVAFKMVFPSKKKEG